MLALPFRPFAWRPSHFPPWRQNRNGKRWQSIWKSPPSMQVSNTYPSGRLFRTCPKATQAIPEMLSVTQATFLTGLMTLPGQAILSLPAVRACAGVIHQAANLSPDGFANLRFAALANAPAGTPFFPAAYHSGGSPTFALAMEAADLGILAFSQATSILDARRRLVEVVEKAAGQLECCRPETGTLLVDPIRWPGFNPGAFPRRKPLHWDGTRTVGCPCSRAGRHTGSRCDPDGRIGSRSIITVPDLTACCCPYWKTPPWPPGRARVSSRSTTSCSTLRSVGPASTRCHCQGMPRQNSWRPFFWMWPLWLCGWKNLSPLG